MNATNKLRAANKGKPLSELTRFKDAWNKRLTGAQKDFWRSRFASTDSQEILRSEILNKLKFKLEYDKQLTMFRQWVEAQDQRDLMAAKIEERKRELLAGGATLEEAQDVLLTEASAYSVAARDFKLGVRVSGEISKAVSSKLDRDKFEFDASREALAKLETLKAIKTNSKLTEDQKLEQARLELFGVTPK